MSSPEELPTASGDERHLTIIVVPHGDLETRSFIVSYAKLKLLVVLCVVLLLAFGTTLAALLPVMSQAARVPALEAELRQLDSERARVAELARTLQEVEAQYERVRQLLGADAPAAGENAPVLPPLRSDTGRAAPGAPGADNNGGPVSRVDLWPLSARGFVTRALNRGQSNHPGVDIAVALNSQIRAAGAGRVRAAGTDEVYGLYIVIDHGDGLESVYGHASRLLVTAGNEVQRGDVIALSGSTGRSTAPHLHFEVRKDGKAVDPLLYVRQP
jgi:murein DD-endopeptidase MepM/ murein hydrolase activator NlpD